MHFLHFFVGFFTLVFLSLVSAGDKNIPPETPPVIINPEKGDEKLDDKKSSNISKDNETKEKCEHTDYRSYIECLLSERKREKRQGYPYQQGCSGTNCNVVQQQPCSGISCNVVQQQPCSGISCNVVQQQPCSGISCNVVQQQPCFGNGCGNFGNNCGGNGCTQINQNCNVPPCKIPSEPIPPPKVDIGNEILRVKYELGLVREQNERLIRTSENVTSFILQILNRPVPGAKIIREPVLVGHNSTTNIDINNYMNNNNVVNVPETKSKIHDEKTNETNCCTVVRPKTCHRTVKPPHFVCGHKKHRTCGSHCSMQRVVYVYVKPGCNENPGEKCVSYNPYPYNPTGYPTSGYYPALPQTYYPTFGAQYPIYPPLQMPIYAPPPMYPIDDISDTEDCVEDCDTEVKIDDCNDTDTDCKSIPRRGDRDWLRPYRDIPMNEIRQVEKETEAIKRSEDQLTASINMLKEAVELKKLNDQIEKDDKLKKGVNKESSVPSPPAGPAKLTPKTN